MGGELNCKSDWWVNWVANLSGYPNPAQEKGPSGPCRCANPVRPNKLLVQPGIPALQELAVQGNLYEKCGAPDHSEEKPADEESTRAKALHEQEGKSENLA
jgi:hypothetical protein